MTIRDLYHSCDNITIDTDAQIYRHREMKQFYASDFENLSFEKTTMVEACDFAGDARISSFWIEESKDRFATLVLILLLGDEI